MIKLFKSSCEARKNLLTTRYRINNAKTTSVDISNIKLHGEMGVLSERMEKHKFGSC